MISLNIHSMRKKNLTCLKLFFCLFLAAIILFNTIHVASADNLSESDLGQNQQSVSENVTEKQVLDENMIIKRLFHMILELEKELDDFAVDLSSDDMNSNIEKITQSINAAREKIRKEKEALTEYICNLERERFSLYLGNDNLYKWKLASALVDRISDIYGIELDNVKLNRFEDEHLIPKEAKTQSVCSADWGIIKLDNERFFNPFEKISKAAFERTMEKFRELLINPPEVQVVDVSLPVVSPSLEDDVYKIIDALAKNSKYNYHISVYDFATNKEINYNASDTIVPASLIKVLYLCTYLEEVEKGNLSLNTVHTLTKNDKYAAGNKVVGTGTLQYQKEGNKYSFETLLSYMISISDNVASNIIIEALGKDRINAAAQKYGMKDTWVYNKFFELKEPENKSTAKDLIIPLLLLENRYIKDQLAQKGIDMMKKTSNKNRIGRLLPKTLTVANKSGTISKLVGDMALIYFPDREPIAMTVLITSKNKGAVDANQAEPEIGKVALNIVEYFQKYKYPSLYINGEKIKGSVAFRYINNVPYIDISGITAVENVNQDKIVLIENKKYYPIDDMVKNIGYSWDIVDNRIIHIYEK